MKESKHSLKISICPLCGKSYTGYPALSRTDNIGKVRRGTSASDAMEQFLIVGTIKSGRNTVGYVIQNAGCGLKRVKRQQVIELAKAGKIGNARVQMYKGAPILKGVNCDISQLPKIEA